MWFFDLVDFIQPSLYIGSYQPNGTNATWPHRSNFVRAAMNECERISNLTVSLLQTSESVHMNVLAA
jgi:hypothetical protein